MASAWKASQPEAGKLYLAVLDYKDGPQVFQRVSQGRELEMELDGQQRELDGWGWLEIVDLKLTLKLTHYFHHSFIHLYVLFCLTLEIFTL